MIKITTLQEIHDLAISRRSVCGPDRKHHHPAAWVINMTGQCILQLMARGLYQYVIGCACQTPGDICPKCFEQIKEIEF